MVNDQQRQLEQAKKTLILEEAARVLEAGDLAGRLAITDDSSEHIKTIDRSLFSLRKVRKSIDELRRIYENYSALDDLCKKYPVILEVDNFEDKSHLPVWSVSDALDDYKYFMKKVAKHYEVSPTFRRRLRGINFGFVQKCLDYTRSELGEQNDK